MTAFSRSAGADPAPAELSVYVSPAGNDAWSGRLPAPGAGGADGPFRTLARAVKDLRPGWTCHLRGGVYRETLRPVSGGEPGRPVVFRAYEGEEAVISGADLLTNWTAGDAGVYSASMDWTLDDQDQVFYGNAMLDEARWPDRRGSLLEPERATAAGGSLHSLTDPALPAGDLAGAWLWCAGGARWIGWTERVERHDAAARTLHFKAANAHEWYAPKAGSRYVLMGLRSFLDAPGEWWRDAARNRLLLIPPAGADPAGMAIEVKRRVNAIDLSGLRHVRIEGLRFRAGGVRTDDKTEGIRLTRCTGTHVAHSYRWDRADEAGVVIRGRDNEVDSCELAWSSGSILRVSGSGHRIVNCFIHHGNYGAKWGGAVALAGRRILFSHNTVRHSGRDLVSVHRLMESLVQHNILSDAGWLTCDLGMTYGHDTDFMNTRFRYNVVHDNRAEGCAMGIYFDHCSHNAIVHNNVIYNVGDDPVRLNNPGYFNLVLNNSAWRTGPLTTYDHTRRNDLFGNRVANNLFNGPVTLPAHVDLQGNLDTPDPGYEDPAAGRFTLRPGSAAAGAGVAWGGLDGSRDAGAFPLGREPWKAGHDFARPPSPIWEQADVDGMNRIINACFELEELEGWTVKGAGQAVLGRGNGWGNRVHGGKADEPTGTSRRELRLEGGAVSVEQAVTGLNPGVPHTFSAWVKAEGGASVRIGVRHGDGREAWGPASEGAAWSRAHLEFRTDPGETGVTVIVAKGDGGVASCDNLGLPRTPAE